MKHFFTTLCILILSLQLNAKNAPIQSPKVKGLVYENLHGELMPVPFANVICKGTTVGTYAGTEGNFTLNLKEGKHTIIVSCVGYKPITRTIKVRKNKSFDLFNIELKPTNTNTAYQP